MSDIRIAEFEDRYADDFARLNYEWIAKYYGVEEHDRDILDHPKSFVIDEGGKIFFALVGEDVAGTVALIKIDGESFELSKMAVSPQFQGRGLGDLLMRACVDHAKDNNAKSIILESNTKQAAAINLYRKFGFVETPLDPNSQYVRANIRMQLVL